MKTEPLDSCQPNTHLCQKSHLSSDYNMSNQIDQTMYAPVKNEFCELPPFLPQTNYNVYSDEHHYSGSFVNNPKCILPSPPSYNYRSFVMNPQPPMLPPIISTEAAQSIETSIIRYGGSSGSENLPTSINNIPIPSDTVLRSPIENVNPTATSTASYTTLSTPTATVSKTTATTNNSNGNNNNSTTDGTKKGTRRPEKPQISYINLIAQAIRASPNNRLTLNEIYTYLSQK